MPVEINFWKYMPDFIGVEYAFCCFHFILKHNASPIEAPSVYKYMSVKMFFQSVAYFSYHYEQFWNALKD